MGPICDPYPDLAPTEVYGRAFSDRDDFNTNPSIKTNTQEKG